MSSTEYIKVDSRGKASFCPVGSLSIHCDLDVTYFPFDKHDCEVKLESMRYTVEQQLLLVTKDAMRLSNYMGPPSNDQWHIEALGPRNGSITDAFGAAYSHIGFGLRLRRRSEFFIVALILPLISISFVEGTIFILPNDSIEKLQLSFASLLAISFFSSMMTDELPHKSTRMPILLVVINLYTGVIALMTILEAGSIYFARMKEGSRSFSSGKISRALNTIAVNLFLLSMTAGTITAVLILPLIK